MKRIALLVCGLFLLVSGVASAQDSPKIEAFGGYSYLRANAYGSGYNFNGGSGSLDYNVTPWLGVVGDFGGYHWSQTDVDGTVVTYLFGPKLSYRAGRWTPFAQTLFGGAHLSGSVSEGPEVRPRPETSIGFGSGSENSFAMALGGGLDFNATEHIGVRVIQAEYLYTDFGLGGGSDHQNNARISAGVVFRW